MSSSGGSGTSGHSGSTMKKSNVQRMSRQGVPQDLVSCPPTLNTQRTQRSRKSNEFVQEFMKPSPLVIPEEESTTPPIYEDYGESGDDDSEFTGFTLATPNSKPKEVTIVEDAYHTRRHQQKQSSPPRHHSSGRDSRQRSQLAKASSISSSKGPSRHTSSSRIQRRRAARDPSVASSVVSWDSMSHSVYSVYTNASVYARRPSWGHYVIGMLVFFAWTMHHRYQPQMNKIFQSAVDVYEDRRPRLVTDQQVPSVTQSTTKETMLRGVVREEIDREYSNLLAKRDERRAGGSEKKDTTESGK